MKKIYFPFSLFGTAMKSARSPAQVGRLPGRPPRSLPSSLPSSVARSFSRLGGVSLMETIMAVAVGGVVASAGTVALTRYAEGSRVDSAAEQMVSYAAATELWLTDNYETLRSVSAGSGATRVSATVLEPYLGAPVRTDAFRHTYEIAVRRYNYTTPKAGGGVTTRTAVQAALLARGGDGTLVQKPEMRARIAAKAGAPIGYVATAAVSCDNPATGAPLASGSLCGSFGAYAVNNAALPAAERFPAAAITGATLVAISTVGDTAMEGASAAAKLRPGETITADQVVLEGFGTHYVDIPEICLDPGVVVDLVLPSEVSARDNERHEVAYKVVHQIMTYVGEYEVCTDRGSDRSGNDRSCSTRGGLSQSFRTADVSVRGDYKISRSDTDKGARWRVDVMPKSEDLLYPIKPFSNHVSGGMSNDAPLKDAIVAYPGFVDYLKSISTQIRYAGGTRLSLSKTTFHRPFSEPLAMDVRWLKDEDWLRIPASKTLRQRALVRCTVPKE